MCSAMMTILSARVQHCRVRGDRVAPSVGHSIAAQVRSAGPGRRLPSASSRSLSRANPSPPRLGVHASYSSARSARRWGRVACAPANLAVQARPSSGEGVGSDGPERIGHNGFTRRRPRWWWHGSATSLVGAPARRGAGHERDTERKGGPGHRWRIRDRPRQCFGACARRQLPSTSSPHRAGQSVPPTASPSTPEFGQPVN